MTMIDETPVTYSPAVPFGPADPLVELDRVTRDRDALRTIRDDLLRDLSDLRARHESFRDEVRTMAIEKADELGWCTPGLNAALIELGLDPRERAYRVPVEIRQTVWVDVEAVDEDAARDLVDNDWTARDVARNADDYDWEMTVGSSYDVEEAD